MISRVSASVFVGMVLSALAFSPIATVAAPLAPGQELVKFRMSTPRTVHFDNAAKAKAVHEVMTQIGCQCKLEEHNDHYDLTIHCPKWRQLEFKSHEDAHRWEAWLKKLGFETRHAH